MRRAVGTLALVLSTACAADDPAFDPSLPAAQSAAPAAERGNDDSTVASDHRPALCARGRSDEVRDVFCAAIPPDVSGLSSLQALLHLVPDAPEGTVAQGYPSLAPVTLLGHSTALSGQRVSPLNPRMIVIGKNAFMAFQRGVQKVEVIATARNDVLDDGILNFYLIEFEQACNDQPAGCSHGDLYTPSVEENWLRVRIRDDEDLKNTPNDCRQCHQRGRTGPTLLMRELNNPWTHFFRPMPATSDQDLGPGVQGSDLLQDYVNAKGDERYGGFPPASIEALAPFLLETTVGPRQPVLFDAPGIESERYPYDAATKGYPADPGPSPTWLGAYEAFKSGEQLALPFIEMRVTDPVKQQALSEAYARYSRGELDADQLPDLGAIFPDDPALRARIGLQTEPGASAQDALIQACGSCHNDVLDQSISRALFNIDLWQLDQLEIERAIDRIQLGPSDHGVMPPPEARQLDPATRERLLAYLRSDPLASTPDARLQHAAAMGMAGGQDRRSGPRK